MRFLDLCAGIGGFSLGLEWAGMECVAQVEIDEYCNKVLQKHWPNVQRWGDIKSVNLADLPAVELICGGYPCQPFSVAGKRRGAQDDRYLWPYVFEIVTALRSTWCLFENVAGHVSMGLDAVLSDLEGLGYACQPLVIPACAVGAWHRRDRIWIIAHAQWVQQPRQEARPYRRVGGEQQPVPWDRDWKDALREFRRVDDGLPYGVERTDGLRNAVVPQVVEKIGRAIYAAHYGIV